jgi:hypothetical protein
VGIADLGGNTATICHESKARRGSDEDPAGPRETKQKRGTIAAFTIETKSFAHRHSTETWGNLVFCSEETV